MCMTVWVLAWQAGEDFGVLGFSRATKTPSEHLKVFTIRTWSHFGTLKLARITTMTTIHIYIYDRGSVCITGWGGFQLMDGIQQEMSDDFLSVLQDDDDAKVNIARFVGHDQTVTNSSLVLFNDDPGKSLSNWFPLEPLATPMSTPLSLSPLPRSRFQSAFVDTFSDQVWR